ncbi:hypothetical protein COCMIDRAFT_8509 [Bipolaris oryzae ATCC 44560]|uniref:Carboxylic ester hydrolase n=1 Tax=Bipolaris oryzae ATCC 44560 TaxID=930090 RepID=W6Z2H6_COCMI|nr:uncharacterized protein COCMIDRAFT_8509 [Bipolaris oryzae ATCC 44560]EUC41839.1 hypothetical protein COCMIDRAFT_8509 [Bipolaris oryzae ATCC 44560]
MFRVGAATAALLGAVYAQNSSSLPTVDLGYQVYRASGFNETGNFYNFSNIRYAAPPVGELRWAPPQAPATNRSAINNGDESRICPQANGAWGATVTASLVAQALGRPPIPYVPSGANASAVVPPRDPRESEDCLFLDVFVPEDVFESAGKGFGAPVLVWIYGGGYTGGSKNANPAGLLAASGNSTNGDVIYVAMNYRLGALGWMGGPSFQSEGGTSNLGLYDQRLALEWVQENIHLFGGDKNRVTVFGESAGGGSIMHQITAYGGSKGPAPFQQAIPQSPGWQPVNSLITQETVYDKYLNLTGATSLAELRALSSDDVIRANAQQIIYDSPYGSYTYGPVVDGDFVPLQPGLLLAQGRFDKDVRVMIGYNADEGAVFTPTSVNTSTALRAQVGQSYANAPQSTIDYIVDTLYPPVFDGSLGYTNDYERGKLIVAESAFTCNTYFLSEAYGNETYVYLFAVPPALHGQDVPYTYYDGGALSDSVRNATVARALQEFITSFAETGVPDAVGVKEFQVYGPNATVLELDITGFEEVRDRNANARCAWWQKALY